MARPLRLEYAGALYHVTSRGDDQEDIYLDDRDRQAWLEVLGHVCQRFNWVVHAYCQMTNHYHLLVETVDGNLSQGMRQLNGVYTQRFNRRHSHVGHLYQGRYKAILVQKEAHLLELARYVVLNPVRAGMVRYPDRWRGSSYRAMVGTAAAPEWLDTDGLLARFGKQRKRAVQAYRRFVLEGRGLPSPLEQIRHQSLLGDERFVKRHQRKLRPEKLRGVSKKQRRAVAKTLDHYRKRYRSRGRSDGDGIWNRCVHHGGDRTAFRGARYDGKQGSAEV